VSCFCDVRDVVPALPRLIATGRACGRAVKLGSTDLAGFAATRNLDEIIQAVAAGQSSARQAAA